jgi:hypothetical protein
MTFTSNASTRVRPHRLRWSTAVTTGAIAVLLAAGCGGERDADSRPTAPVKAGEVSDERAPGASGSEARESDQAESRGVYGY